MTLVELFESQPGTFLLAIGLVGLAMGSFLNVVILRLPVMLERAWRAQCEDASAGLEPDPESPARFDLIHPRSRCPHCDHPIAAWENIPVLSYLLLRGRCSACSAPISLRYPMIEVVTAGLSVAVAWTFGFGWETLGALVLTWALISLTVIDLDRQLLPDVITLPVLWLGLLLSLFGVFTDAKAAILGATIGYLSLWSLYQAHKALTGKEGMGYGDFKLLALLGAWLGWQSLPVVILLASVVGACVGAVLMASRGQDRNLAIPFGPYLAAAGWVALLWGEPIADAYLRWSGLAL